MRLRIGGYKVTCFFAIGKGQDKNSWFSECSDLLSGGRGEAEGGEDEVGGDGAAEGCGG